MTISDATSPPWAYRATQVLAIERGAGAWCVLLPGQTHHGGAPAARIVSRWGFSGYGLDVRVANAAAVEGGPDGEVVLQAQ